MGAQCEQQHRARVAAESLAERAQAESELDRKARAIAEARSDVAERESQQERVEREAAVVRADRANFEAESVQKTCAAAQDELRRAAASIREMRNEIGQLGGNETQSSSLPESLNEAIGSLRVVVTSFAEKMGRQRHGSDVDDLDVAVTGDTDGFFEGTIDPSSDVGSVSHCAVCGTGVGKRHFRRRRNCQLCGKCVCSACSPNFIQLPGMKSPQRTCASCIGSAYPPSTSTKLGDSHCSVSSKHSKNQLVTDGFVPTVACRAA